jgi:hypothetical protein
VIGFSGTSTLHSWSGKVSPQPFVATVTYDDSGRPSRLQAEVKVQAGKMDTAEPKRDENMLRALRVSDFPFITAVIDAPFSKILTKETPAELPLTLEIMGKKRVATAKISNWTLKNDIATFDLDFEVLMKDYGIRVPAVLLVIRVGDVVKVHAKVQLVRKSA